MRENNNYHISLKSHYGEILFQGPVWCSNNSRVAKFRGQRLQRLTHMHIHACTASFNNKPICINFMHVKCACACVNYYRSLTMWQDFKDGVYWNKLADRYGNISRVAGFQGAAIFKEIRYYVFFSHEKQ